MTRHNVCQECGDWFVRAGRLCPICAEECHERYDDDPNREIVSVTNRVGDTLTIIRAQEDTLDTAKNFAEKTYRVRLGITKAMWEAIQTPRQFHQGLQLQTHRDSDLAPSYVEIVGADSIIMDDAVELRNDNGEWSGKTANIAVSGAGGLDAGT